MSNAAEATAKAIPDESVRTGNIVTLERVAVGYARIALAAAFLSAVSSRFGIWQMQFSWEKFASFVNYTAQVNSFMPAFTIPILAWAATAAELTLGISLLVGVRLRWVAFGSALLLALFATAMAISFGFKEPLDYSVYSASAAAMLLALHQPRRNEAKYLGG